ncbi:hypothetical protein BDZ89DRAFT_903855, partial [Hymenopellis radicata]
PPTIVLKSSDEILFCVHRRILTDESSNALGTSLATGDIEAESIVLNIIHRDALYNILSAPYNPSFDTLISAVHRLPLYDLFPTTFITPTKHLSNLIYLHARHHPIEAYILAAHHNIGALAVLVSGHLLSFKLSELTEDMAERMGGRYLGRLFLLHSVRMDRLKQILL